MVNRATPPSQDDPQEFSATQRAWDRLSRRFYWLNLSLGSVSAVLCAVYAANAAMNGAWFPKSLNPFLGVIAALLTFVLTSVKPSARYAAYKEASHELEKAILAFRYDPAMTVKDLAAAEARAIDTLDRISK